MEQILSILFMQIYQMSITAGYCILIVLALRLVFHGMPAKYKYVLWLAVALRLVCPVLVSTQMSLFNLPVFSGQAESEKGEGLPGLSGFAPVPGSRTGKQAGTEDRMPEPVAMEDEAGVAQKLFEAGKYVWAAGTAAFLFYFMSSLWRTRRSVCRAVKVPYGQQVDKGPAVYECDGLPSPFVAGVFHPRIYIPCSLLGEQRELVLMHEYCHIRRKDHLVKPASFLLLCLYWFHPLVWAAWHGMCRDMEMSCDEKVLEQLTAAGRKEYTKTLLAFAAGERMAAHLPTAFGEQDVKQRIRHALAFKKPAVWAGALAFVLAAAALLMLGTDGMHAPAAKEYTDIAKRLYEARNPYVGDAPANGELIGVIAEALPDSIAARARFTTRLQTSEKPYAFHFMLEEDPRNMESPYRVYAPSVLMLALTDNLGLVQWYYKGQIWSYLNIQGAKELCGVADIKEYGASPEKVQELLDILEGLEVPEAEADTAPESFLPGDMDTETFMDWYGGLPESLCSEAVPYESEVRHTEGGAAAHMVILAQTKDGAVTVYGCCSGRFGRRGMLIDYRGAPGGRSSQSRLDSAWYWHPGISAYHVYMSDYDQDKTQEIALVMPGELAVFEIYSTGHLEGGTFSRKEYIEEIYRLVSAVTDEENKMVHVIENNSVLSVPLMSIHYEAEAPNVRLHDGARFFAEDELWLETAVVPEQGGVSEVAYGGIQQEYTLRFRVIYDPSKSPGSGCFTLAL